MSNRAFSTNTTRTVVMSGLDGGTSESIGLVAYNTNGSTYSLGFGANTLVFGKNGSAVRTITPDDIDKYSATSCGLLTQQGTVAHNSIKKMGRVVNASARIYGGSWTANGSFFSIPAGYRPPNTVYGIGYLLVDGDEHPCICSVDSSNGYVTLGYSASKTATQVGFAITYFV